MARGSVERRVSARTGAVSWRARVSYVDDAGVRRHRSKTFTAKKRAEAWLRETIDRIERGQRLDLAPDTVAEVYARWHRHIRRERAASTAHHYARWYRTVIGPAFGERKVGSITPVELQVFYDELAERYAPGTVGAIANVVKGIFRTAVEDGLIDVDPSRGRRVPRPKQRPKAWTPAQARRFLAVARPGPDDIWVVALTTGLRIGELRALMWDCVDLDRRRLVVRRTAQQTPAGDVIAETTKTASSQRLVSLPEIAVEALKRQPRGIGEVLVFPGRDGGIRNHPALLAHLTHACKRAGLPRLTPHGLRHTAATLMLHSGVHPKVAADQLGHASSLLTLDLYSHTSDELQAAAADALDEALTMPVEGGDEETQTGTS